MHRQSTWASAPSGLLTALGRSRKHPIIQSLKFPLPFWHLQAHGMNDARVVHAHCAQEIQKWCGRPAKKYERKTLTYIFKHIFEILLVNEVLYVVLPCCDISHGVCHVQDNHSLASCQGRQPHQNATQSSATFNISASSAHPTQNPQRALKPHQTTGDTWTRKDSMTTFQWSLGIAPWASPHCWCSSGCTCPWGPHWAPAADHGTPPTRPFFAASQRCNARSQGQRAAAAPWQMTWTKTRNRSLSPRTSGGNMWVFRTLSAVQIGKIAVKKVKPTSLQCLQPWIVWTPGYITLQLHRRHLPQQSQGCLGWMPFAEVWSWCDWCDFDPLANIRHTYHTSCRDCIVIILCDNVQWSMNISMISCSMIMIWYVCMCSNFQTAWFVTKKSYSWPAKWDWPQFRHRSWWHPRANSQLAPVGTNGWPRSNGPCKQPWPEPLQRSWKLTQCNISQHHCSVKSGKLIWGQITEHSADPSTSWESAYLNRVLIFPAKCPVHDSLQLGCWAAADHIGFQSFLGHLCQPG